MKFAGIGIIILVAGMQGSLVAAECYYVAPNGDDKNSGSMEKPFQSISHAQRMVRTSSDLRKKPITVFIRQGTYYLDEALVFSPKDSGTADAPITYSSYEGEQVVVSGGRKLSLDWKPYTKGIFQAATPAGLEMDQLEKRVSPCNGSF